MPAGSLHGHGHLPKKLVGLLRAYMKLFPSWYHPTRLGVASWRHSSVGGDSGIASGPESDGESGCEEAIVKGSEMREKWVVKWEV
jgi:hypothetical protein